MLMIFWLLIGLALFCLYKVVQVLRGMQSAQTNSNQAPPASSVQQNGGGTEEKSNQCELTFEIGGKSIGTVVVQLFDDTPLTSKNFSQLCSTGQYNNVPVHRIVPQFMIQTGDITNGDGTGGKSIYGDKFADENFIHKHEEAGLLSMANSGPNTNSSQFFITTEPAPWLDGKHVVFGKVTKGMKVVKTIEGVRCQGETPVEDVRIASCKTF